MINDEELDAINNDPNSATDDQVKRLVAEVRRLQWPAGVEMAKEETPAMYCEHANEAPLVCPCRGNCYCKTRTCKDKCQECGVAGHDADIHF